MLVFHSGYNTGLSYADTITLSLCYEEAENHNPALHELEKHNEIFFLKKNNIYTGYLPEISINTAILYAYEVIDFSGITKSIPLQGITFPNASHDQYKSSIDIKQVVFDGLATLRLKEVEEAVLNQKLHEITLSQYKLYEIINKLYFSIFLMDKKISLAKIFREELEKRLTELQSAVENGVILKENCFILQAEQIKVSQQIAALTVKSNASLSLLSLYTGLPVNSSSIFVLPDISITQNPRIVRPEKESFLLQKNMLNSQKRLLTSSKIPKAIGTFSLEYGNPPGNNFLRDEFDFSYSAGLGIQWKITDWNSVKRKKAILDRQSQILSIKETEFDRSITAALKNQYAEIKQMELAVTSDKELISIREKITGIVEAKLTNGTINSTEYLSELNAEKQAKINYEVHQIQLIQAKIDYLTISGEIYSLTL
jgi:outer membrane protein TolC